MQQSRVNQKSNLLSQKQPTSVAPFIIFCILFFVFAFFLNNRPAAAIVWLHVLRLSRSPLKISHSFSIISHGRAQQLHSPLVSAETIVFCAFICARVLLFRRAAIPSAYLRKNFFSVFVFVFVFVLAVLMRVCVRQSFCATFCCLPTQAM